MRIIKEYRVIEGEMETTISLISIDGQFKLVISEGIADDYAWLYDNPPPPTIHEYIFGDPSSASAAFLKAVSVAETDFDMVR